MTSDEAVSRAKEIAAEVLAPRATVNDKEARFSREAVAALGERGLLGILVPVECGGSGLGPGTLADVIDTLSVADPSVAMVFLMHCLGAAAIATAPSSVPLHSVLEEIAAGAHLTTLAFSEAGSRSHFWAPVSRARRNGRGVLISASKSFVTSAGYAQSYVASTQRPEATQPTDSTLYLVPAETPGLRASGPWEGMGLRANASAPMVLEDCEVPAELQLTAEGAGLQVMMEVILPLFNLGSAAVALGICRAVVAATRGHIASARFDHLGASLGESLPNLRANLATMQIETDGLAARIRDVVGHLERPDDATALRVLEVKAAAGETAIGVTSLAMRTCGGAAFSKHTSIERFFRDAHAGAVMAPTVDVLREMIGRSLLGMPLL
jgi:alkylation response protein AidB-like acyl-CoA dehydrogenase